MASEVLLLQAASGLTKLMSGSKMDGAIKDSTVAQISAAIFYQSNVMAKLISNKEFSRAFSKTIFTQIEKDFGEYIDAKARISPKSYHHIYEWQRTGNKDSRLFKINKVSEGTLSFQVGYVFLPSKSMVPTQKGTHRHVFANKAFIMEQGRPVVISPRFSERLVFDVNGYTVFMPKGSSVTVNKPGGVATKNSFESAYKHFFTSSLVSNSIKASGFQNLFNSSLTKAMRLPVNIKRVQYKFSPNSIVQQAEAAVNSAFTGV